MHLPFVEWAIFLLGDVLNSITLAAFKVAIELVKAIKTKWYTRCMCSITKCIGIINRMRSFGKTESHVNNFSLSLSHSPYFVVSLGWFLNWLNGRRIRENEKEREKNQNSHCGNPRWINAMGMRDEEREENTEREREIARKGKIDEMCL